MRSNPTWLPQPRAATVRVAVALTALLALLTLPSCSALLSSAGYPPEARRNTPPEGIEARAAAVGKRAPTIAISDDKGAFIAIGGERLKPQLVLFYRGAWCPYCRTQLEEYDKRRGEIDATGARLLAVSVDTPEASAALRERLALSIELGCDPERKATRAYGVHDPGNDIAWPAVMLLDAKGRLLWRHIERQYRERLPLDEVLAKVTAALGPRDGAAAP